MSADPQRRYAGPQGALPSAVATDLPSDHFRPARPARIDQSVEEPHRSTFEAILLRPELRPLSGGLTVRCDESLTTPFQVDVSGVVRVHPRHLTVPAATAVLLRHAFEIAITAPLTADLDDRFRTAALWLGARTAGLYLEGLIDAERRAAQDRLPDSLKRSYRILAQPVSAMPQLPAPDDQAALAGLAGLLEGTPNRVTAPAAAVLSPAWEIFCRAAPIAAPAEQVLVSGGDPRVRVDPTNGTNGYGSSPQPRPAALSFSSSTASTISEQSFASVERLRQSLIEHALYDDLEAILGAEAKRTRQEILAACGAQGLSKPEVILTASGTDAEYHALFLAGAAEEGAAGLLNIVVAPDETGSGVPLAAAGRHFAAETALGVAVDKGEVLAGLDGERIQTATIALRDDDGAPRNLADIDRELEHLVQLGVLGGMRVLVHLLDSSKTGLGAPSLDAVLRLRERYPEALDVVVDACQMRVSEAGLGGYLTRGFMVMVTGSKFFTGPPFAGALLVPQPLVTRAVRLGPLPEGLHAYCSRSDFSGNWPHRGPALSDRANPGPLFRWQAALWEHRAFEAVPRVARDDCLARLGEMARQAIAASDRLQAVAAPVFDRNRLLPSGAWHDHQSIFPFAVRHDPKDADLRSFTMTEARVLHRLLMADLSNSADPSAPHADRALLSRACHLGQPVKVPQPGQADSGALRLCLSARLVSRIVLDPLYASTPEARFDRAAREISATLRKVELVAGDFERYAAASQTRGA